MENMHIYLFDNELNAEDFIQLRAEAGFMKTPLLQAKRALKNGLFAVTAVHGGRGIGTRIVNRLTTADQRWRILINLF